jgi:hypothetical protein
MSDTPTTTPPATPDKQTFERIPDSGGMLNLRDKKFGKLYVLRLLPRRHKKKRMWLCKCDCGGQPIAVRHDYLLHTNNPKTHCGCENRGLPTLHPEEYHIWNSMLRRCNVQSHVGYAQYGGRGISVCPQWSSPETGFETFLKDVGKRPSKGHSLDRANPNGNYEPGNVNWATAKHQARNKRNSVFLDDPDNPGKKIPAAELAERWGVTYQVMRGRLIRQGKWPGYSRDGGGRDETGDENGGDDESADDTDQAEDTPVG